MLHLFNPCLYRVLCPRGSLTFHLISKPTLFNLVCLLFRELRRHWKHATHSKSRYTFVQNILKIQARMYLLQPHFPSCYDGLFSFLFMSFLLPLCLFVCLGQWQDCRPQKHLWTNRNRLLRFSCLNVAYSSFVLLSTFPFPTVHLSILSDSTACLWKSAPNFLSIEYIHFLKGPFKV